MLNYFYSYRKAFDVLKSKQCKSVLYFTFACSHAKATEDLLDPQKYYNFLKACVFSQNGTL